VLLVAVLVALLGLIATYQVLVAADAPAGPPLRTVGH
jgi:hypothetical protein